MPRTSITPQTPVTGNGYPTLPLTALAADVTYAAADVSNGNAFVHTGREVIIVRNGHATLPQTVTVKAAPDRFGRTGLDIAVYSIVAGKTAFFGPFPIEGWRQTDGKLWLDASTVDILFGIMRLPSMP